MLLYTCRGRAYVSSVKLRETYGGFVLACKCVHVYICLCRLSCICINTHIPAVPHKAVAQVPKIRHYRSSELL